MWPGSSPSKALYGVGSVPGEQCVDETVSHCITVWRSLWARWDLGVAQYAEWVVSLEELHVQKGGIPEQWGVLVGNVPVEQCGAGNSPWYSSVWSRMYSGRGGVWCGKSRTYIQWKCLGWGVAWVSAVGKAPLYSTV